jgi:hypothetical protein
MVTITEHILSGNLELYDDDILLDWWETLSREVIRQKRVLGFIEMVLQRRMRENNAKKLLSATLTVELGTPTYDFGKLRVLGEHVPEEIFKKGFVPAHEETVVRKVADKFDMRTVNSWKSYGQHIVDIIDAAEIADTRQISIKHRKEGKDGTASC